MEFISKKRLIYLKKLNQKRYRAIEKRFIIEGEKLIKEALDSNFEIELVLCDKEFYEKNPNLINIIKSKDIEVLYIHSKESKLISDVVTPQGIFGVLKITEKEFDPSLKKKNAEFIALDNISDAGNLGTIIRTAYWFGLDGIIIGENSIEIYNPKVIRASMGSIFYIPIWNNINLKEKILELKKIGYKIISADPTGNDSIKKLKLQFPKVIILGSESHGISTEIMELCDFRIKIKGTKRFDSLNLAVAAGIIMWEMKK
jgi:TrmH family RNA methyltransferase